MAKDKFFDMNTEERFIDLQKRVTQFSLMELPGQPIGMHMGTSYLIDDLWQRVIHLYSLERLSSQAMAACAKLKELEVSEVSVQTESK